MTEREIPPGILLVRDFVNTLEVDHGVDHFATADGLREWLDSRSLLPDPASPSDAELALAREVREALRDLMEKNAGGDPGAACIDCLNRAAAGGSLVVRFGADGESSLAAGAGGFGGALGQIMAAVFTAMVDGTWSRLKPCRLDDCRWVFYDQSKNQSGAWCSMRVCGNRAKARSFRARQKAPK